MKKHIFLPICYVLCVLVSVSTGCDLASNQQKVSSDKAEMLTLSLTIENIEYNAKISGTKASITLNKNVSVPSSAKISQLTISEKASVQPILNESLVLNEGIGKIVVTAGNKSTKNTYSVEVQTTNSKGNTSQGTDATHRFAVGFYNCENLFDTKDAPGKDDKEFLPTSAKKYTNEVYLRKLRNIAEVLLRMEENNPNDSLAWIGLAEVENRTVLEDLVNHANVRKYGWKIIHVESSDPRGIDVALLYNPLLFVPTTTSKVIGVQHSREIIWVRGKLLGKSTHVFLNHWTSRLRGGADKRQQFADAVKEQVLQIVGRDPSDYIFIAGDFNDNPDDISISQILNAQPINPLQSGNYLINGFNDLFKQNIGGTSYFNGSWDIFDQIILSSNMHPSNKDNKWRAYKHAIFSPTFMQTGTAPQRNAPRRFYEGDHLEGGYSDHFPVYVEMGIY